MPHPVSPLPRLALAATMTLAAACGRPPLEPPPGPSVLLTTVSHVHQPCMDGWCSHTIVVAAADSATGQPVAVELSLAGVGRYPAGLRTRLPAGEVDLDWSFPHRDGTFTLNVCVARDDRRCLSYRLTRHTPR